MSKASLKRTRTSAGMKEKSVLSAKRKKGDYQKGREMPSGIGRELKAFDVATSAPNFAVAGVFTVLNTPVNGSELYQRVGRKIYMRSLHIKGFIENAATSIQDIGRIIIFYDSQPNAAASNLATLLQDSNAAAATSGLSSINLTNRERFKIIKDHFITLPSVSNAAGVLSNTSLQDQQENFSINWFIKLKGLETVFNAVNGGTVADITSGSLYMCLVSQNQSNTWAFQFNSRLRYYDT